MDNVIGNKKFIFYDNCKSTFNDKEKNRVKYNRNLPKYRTSIRLNYIFA